MAAAEKNSGLNLPAGLHSFSALRKADSFYFDKTPFIKLLLSGSRHYFLSRPSGFGKTLLLTALQSFFSGEAGAFEELAIEQEAMRNALTRYELIYADLEEGNEAVEAALKRLEECAGGDWPVVLLVDGFIPDFPGIEESFTKLLKAQGRLQHKLDFVMIAGRSPFSALSENPETFGLLDISCDPAFAEICGFTSREIRKIPADWLRKYAKRGVMTITKARKRLKEIAGSCCFAPGTQPVYNPADILKAITSGTLAVEENAIAHEDTLMPVPDSSLLASMREDLEEGRPEEFMVKLRAVFSSVAYGAVRLAEAERHFQTYVFLIVRLLGFQESELERLTSAGRIDMRVATERFIYLFEFKTNGSAASALSQIRSRGYLHADQSDPRPVWLIGANYSLHRRSIADWKIAPGRKIR